VIEAKPPQRMKHAQQGPIQQYETQFPLAVPARNNHEQESQLPAGLQSPQGQTSRSLRTRRNVRIEACAPHSVMPWHELPACKRRRPAALPPDKKLCRLRETFRNPISGASSYHFIITSRRKQKQGGWTVKDHDSEIECRIRSCESLRKPRSFPPAPADLVQSDDPYTIETKGLP
jgi:hypothetical protein